MSINPNDLVDRTINGKNVDAAQNLLQYDSEQLTQENIDKIKIFIMDSEKNPQNKTKISDIISSANIPDESQIGFVLEYGEFNDWISLLYKIEKGSENWNITLSKIKQKVEVTQNLKKLLTLYKIDKEYVNTNLKSFVEHSIANTSCYIEDLFSEVEHEGQIWDECYEMALNFLESKENTDLIGKIFNKCKTGTKERETLWDLYKDALVKNNEYGPITLSREEKNELVEAYLKPHTQSGTDSKKISVLQHVFTIAHQEQESRIIEEINRIDIHMSIYEANNPSTLKWLIDVSNRSNPFYIATKKQ